VHEFVSQLVTGVVFALALPALILFTSRGRFACKQVRCLSLLFWLLISFAVRFADNSQLKLHRSTHNNYEFSHEYPTMYSFPRPKALRH